MSLPRSAIEGRRLRRPVVLAVAAAFTVAGCTVGDVEGAAAPAGGGGADVSTAEPASDHTDDADLLDAETHRVSLTRDPFEPLLVPAEAPPEPTDPTDPTEPTDPADPTDPVDPVDPDDPDVDPDDPVPPDDLPPDPKEGPAGD